MTPVFVWGWGFFNEEGMDKKTNGFHLYEYRRDLEWEFEPELVGRA
jgi:hypothetical protein